MICDVGVVASVQVQGNSGQSSAAGPDLSKTIFIGDLKFNEWLCTSQDGKYDAGNKGSRGCDHHEQFLHDPNTSSEWPTL